MKRGAENEGAADVFDHELEWRIVVFAYSCRFVLEMRSLGSLCSLVGMEVWDMVLC